MYTMRGCRLPPCFTSHDWLDKIMELRSHGQICLIELLFAQTSNWISIETGNMALFHCAQDPRKMSLRVGPISPPSERPLERNLKSSLKEGHYMMYLYGT